MEYFLLPLIAFIIATLTSQAGVSGAFLLMPVQISLLGITSPIASAT
ncbi:MAG: sulfite exporter TauE/SafE family protein, partial [Candidatus Desulfofervidus auxilii]|nr:sulfite exporter TauE/SafE family protein [Candidatus Desulfofervidus auxilii]